MTVSEQPRRRPRRASTRQTRLLIVGCGDVGLRVLRLLSPHERVYALTSSPTRVDILRQAGAVPLLGDLDDPASLGRLARLADRVLHLAPPPAQGRTDPRTANLLRVLERGGSVRRLVYASTSGVYGDCGGERVDESRPLQPGTDRAWRRCDAEARVRAFGRRAGCAVAVLRVPGIYALDREGADPRERVRRGAPVLAAADDVFTNHIHADDLARACVRALSLAGPQRVYNVSDDGDRRTGDHYDLVADRCGLPRPPRLTWEQAERQMSPAALSFLSESRRLCNRRLKRELRLRLHYPTVETALSVARRGGRRRDCTRPDPPGGPRA